MVRALPVLLLLLSAACGLAEDERDEKNRYIYLTFYDKAFEAYCLGEFDVDGDGALPPDDARALESQLAADTRDSFGFSFDNWRVSDEIEAGQVLLVLEAMKMQNEITADADGTVKAVNVEAGQNVKVKESLVILG